MGLEEGAKGALTVTAVIANLFASQTTLKHYSTWIFFHNLVSGDSIEITIHVNDPQDVTERIYDKFTVADAQSEPGVFIPFLPTDSFRIEAQKLTGIDREITWVRYESN